MINTYYRLLGIPICEYDISTILQTVNTYSDMTIK